MGLGTTYYTEDGTQIKVHTWNPLSSKPLIELKGPKNGIMVKPEPPPAPVDTGKIKADAVAEYKAKMQAEIDAARAREAEAARKAKEARIAARLAEEEAYFEYMRQKAARKAARQARRDAVVWTPARDEKLVTMIKAGKSYEEIARHLDNDANAKDCQTHYTKMMELWASPPEKKDGKGGGKGSGNGNGKQGNRQSDEDKIAIGKKAGGAIVKLRGGDFTKQQDNKILGMKKGGKTWKEIAAAVGNGVNHKDVENRWDEISAPKSAPRSEPEASSYDSDSDSSDGSVIWVPVRKPSKHHQRSQTHPAKESRSRYHSHERSDRHSRYESPPRRESRYESPPRRGRRHESPARREYRHESPARREHHHKGYRHRERRGYSPDHRGTSRPSYDARREPVLKSILRRGNLKPDRFWTAQDCKDLDMIVATYEERRWPEITSKFHDLTGRMVAIEVMQEKLWEDGYRW